MNEPLVDKITFGIGTGLDSDSDVLTIKPGDSPVDPSVLEDGRLNVEIREGHLNVASNALGTATQSHSLPNGTNTILGWCEDKENNGIIYFVHNSNDDHCIIRYKFDGTFDNISYAEDGWPFNSDYSINKAGVIGTGTDAMLTWTDNNANPCKIKIRDVEYNVYSDLDNGKIYMIKPMPSAAPSLAIGSDTSKYINNIRGKLFQFAYRYIYDTGEKSAVSFYSKVPFNYNDEFISGTYSKNVRTANKITLTLTVDFDNVEKLEIFFRIADSGDGAEGNWVLCDTIDAVYPSTTYVFYNDEYYAATDQDIFERLEDSVPIKSRTQEIIGENRMVYGGVTKGYDQVTPNVSLEYVSASMTVTYNIDAQTIANGNTYDFTLVNNADERYNIVIINTIAGDVETYVLDSDSNYADLDAVINYFVNKINTDTAYAITASNAASKLRIANGTGVSLGATHNHYIISDKEKTMKGGATAYFAIQYYDFAGRSSRAIKTSNTKVYIQHPCEYVGTNLTTYDTYIHGIKYTINHLPPSWATHWQWLYGGNNIEDYFCIPIIIDETTYNGLDSDIARVDDLIRIDFTAMQARFDNRYYNENRITFTPDKGDRIRITGQQFGIGTLLFNEIIDFEILYSETSGSTYYLYIPSWDSYTNKSNINTTGAIFAEFYRIKEIDEDNIVYNEVGDVLAVSGGYHQTTGSTTFSITAVNQSDGVAGIGYINFGDSYRYEMEGYRVTDAAAVYSFYLKNNLESRSSSLLYDSNHNGRGRIAYVDSNYKQAYYNAAQWGGAYSNENITFNEINVFSGSDMVYMDEKYGLIYGLVEEGYVLNVIQQSKVTPIDIGRVQQTLADGESSYVATTSILASNQKRPMVEDVGCIFPRAIVRNNRYIYYPDIYSGEVYRKAPNGQIPISDYGMSNFFRYTFNNILEKGVENVIMTAGWDPVNKMYVLTLLTDTGGSQSIGGNSITVAFHEPSNRWYTFYSFKPQIYARIGENAFLSFNSAVLYKHHSTAADRNTFYGTAYKSEISFIVPSEFTREFETIEEVGNEIWEAPDDDSIVINADATEVQDVQNYTTNYPKMQSELVEGQFRAEDGVFVAKFLRDSTTSTGSPWRLDLINGRPLVGNDIKIKLENDSVTDVYLKIVKIYSSRIS